MACKILNADIRVEFTCPNKDMVVFQRVSLSEVNLIGNESLKSIMNVKCACCKREHDLQFEKE